MYLLQNLPQRITDANGAICSGALLYTYVTGTTTPKTAYTDQSGLTPHPNPIVADSGGQFAQVWLDSDVQYRIKVTKSDGTVLPGYPVDNIIGADSGLRADLASSLLAAKGAGLVGYSAALGYPSGSVGDRLRRSISPCDKGFDAVGNGVADDTAALTACWAACPTYGVIDLGGKTYRITSPIPRPAVGVMVRNGKVFLDNASSSFFYAFVANDKCVFDGVHFLGTGAVGDSASVTFTASVGGASSGTLTAPITNGSYIFTFSDGSKRFVTVTGGTAAAWSASEGSRAQSALPGGVVMTATYPTTPRYQGGIFGGNTGYASPMNTAPAADVTIQSCTFENLTVGSWNGGANGDSVADGWRVWGNKYINIVGAPGLSEGYGHLQTPGNDGVVAFNVFKDIRRHAVYLAGEASRNVVFGNVIDGCDNIAIQSNTFVTQNYADRNLIEGNVISGLTRTAPYGYRSSIGVGMYGKFQNCSAIGNQVYGALDTGIDTSGELSGAAYSDNLLISGNHISMDPTAIDAAIRIDGLQSGAVQGNYLRLKGAQFGVVITSSVTAGSGLLAVQDNTLETTSASAGAFRVALSAQRFVRVFRNTLNGFSSAYTSKLNDTSTAGVVRSDLNRRVGFFGSDAGFTHNSGGSVDNTDCSYIRHAGTLTAARTITLSETNVDQGAEVVVTRTGAGAFNLNVNTGASLLKALTTGQWVRCAFNASNQWEVVGFGSL